MVPRNAEKAARLSIKKKHADKNNAAKTTLRAMANLVRCMLRVLIRGSDAGQKACMQKEQDYPHLSMVAEFKATELNAAPA